MKLGARVCFDEIEIRVGVTVTDYSISMAMLAQLQEQRSNDEMLLVKQILSSRLLDPTGELRELFLFFSFLHVYVW